MCNNYANRGPIDAYREAFAHTRIPLVSPPPSASPNLEPNDDIRPTDPAPILRAVEGGLELAICKWGFSPGRPKAPPVINFRSERRRFDNGRCLIPASAFFEFTGTKTPKTRWRFTASDADWFCLAGLWRPAREDWPDSFTMLTTAPGEDVAPYHDRQVVVLARADWEPWLLDGDIRLLRAGPPGSLRVEESPRPKAAAAGR